MQLAKIDRQALLQRYPEIVFETSVMDLGVVIDEEVKTDVHVGRVTRSCFYKLRQIRTIRDNATPTLKHSFVVKRVDYCNSVHHCSTDRTSSENFECSGSSRASNSEVRTSISVDQRQSALASSCTANKIQDPATGCKLHQPKSTVVSAGTLCAGFSGDGASALTVC